VTTAIDLDAYFERIGYTGGRAPALDTLRAIHLRHPQSIPFENLDPLLGRAVRLDARSIEKKLVFDGRGGYCFEHNLLLSHALKALGFQITLLAARVLWNAPGGVDVVRPRSHMLLLVDLEDGPFIADVGFGGLTLTAPLRLLPDIEQATPHEAFRLVTPSPAVDAAARMRDEFVLQARLDEGWKPLYRFGLQEQLLPDYEVTNWYLSNHPESQFVTGLMAARPELDCRYALRNNRLTVHRRNGRTEQRELASAAELRQTLENAFLLRLPDVPNLDAALTRLIDPQVSSLKSQVSGSSET
jgi:N-hydroxyarylamine O-acetyltransferase